MSQPGGTQKSKELKLVTKQVITPDALKEDKRKQQLLYILNVLNGISEKGLITALYEMKQKGLDLGYNFTVLGNNVFSPQVKEDLTTLLYLGLVENEQGKRLKVTSNGLELLEKLQFEDAFKNQVASVWNEVKTKVQAIDQEQKLRTQRRR